MLSPFLGSRPRVDQGPTTIDRAKWHKEMKKPGVQGNDHEIKQILPVPMADPGSVKGQQSKRKGEQLKIRENPRVKNQINNNKKNTHKNTKK